MASLVEDLVDAFNWRLDLGLRRDGYPTYRRLDTGKPPTPFKPEISPQWAQKASRLDERLVLHEFPHPEFSASNPAFAKRNIQASGASLRTV